MKFILAILWIGFAAAEEPTLTNRPAPDVQPREPESGEPGTPRDARAAGQPLPGQPNQRPNPNLRDAEAIEADARALLEDAKACDTECGVLALDALLGPSCLGALQCSAAISPDTDLDAFTRTARQLDAEMRATGACNMAACAPTEEFEARCVEGRCELLRRDIQPAPRLPPGPSRARAGAPACGILARMFLGTLLACTAPDGAPASERAPEETGETGDTGETGETGLPAPACPEVAPDATAST